MIILASAVWPPALFLYRFLHRLFRRCLVATWTMCTPGTPMHHQYRDHKHMGLACSEMRCQLSSHLQRRSLSDHLQRHIVCQTTCSVVVVFCLFCLGLFCFVLFCFVLFFVCLFLLFFFFWGGVGGGGGGVVCQTTSGTGYLKAFL